MKDLCSLSCCSISCLLRISFVFCLYCHRGERENGTGDFGEEVDACWCLCQVEQENGTGDGGDFWGVLVVGHMVVKLVKWWRVRWQQQGTLLCVVMWFSTRLGCGCHVSFLVFCHYRLLCRLHCCWVSLGVPIWVSVRVLLVVGDVVVWV